MKAFAKFFHALICFHMCSLAHAHPLQLYYQGNAEAAEEQMQALINELESEGKQSELLQELVKYSWLLHEVDQYEKANEVSNSALELAIQIDDEFMIAKTLSWLGWGHAEMGLYDAAMQFYQEALDIAAPEGKIRYIPVWGLSQQELARLYFETGDVSGAQVLLEDTVNFAREHGIEVGVAEGGAHLAQIYLHLGNLGKARELAREAIQNAISCACSITNQLRAKLVLVRLFIKENRRGEARELIEEIEKEAKEKHSKKFLAEAYTLQASLLKPHDYDAKYKLLSQALEILNEIGSDGRGDAEVRLGLIEKSALNSEFYIKNGIEVNQKMLRKVANAYLLTDIANLKLEQGAGDYLAALELASNESSATKALTIQYENSFKLAELLRRQGYDSMAYRYSTNALKALEEMINTESDQVNLDKLLGKRDRLMFFHSDLALNFVKDQENEKFIN